MNKLTPAQLIQRIKELCLEYYEVKELRLTYPANQDEIKITKCRQAIVIIGQLKTIYPSGFLMQVAQYKCRRSSTDYMQRYQTDKQFQFEINEIMNQL